MTDAPTVTVAIPVLNEEAHIQACLDAVSAQTYPAIIEILVVDGGSTDETRALSQKYERVRVMNNPRRIQAAALNLALAEAKGTYFVRVDGHCVIADDYVEQCVAALDRTGAAMVGGAMSPIAEGWMGRGIATAMSSPFGAGPARFHTGGPPGWVDTVYLGAYRTDTARSLGGYAEDVGVNEDAELAYRMRSRGGVWYDPAIRSTYTPRSTLVGLAHQFWTYGRSRAATVRKHPESLAARQLVAPALIAGLATPWRTRVAAIYIAVVLAVAAQRRTRDTAPAGAVALSLPVMHLSWGAGFLRGVFGRQPT